MIADGVPLAWDFDPLEALARWPTELRALLLHSGRYHPRWARWSVLATPVEDYVVPASAERSTHRPFEELRELLTGKPGPWIGYLGYDLGRWIEKLPVQAANDRAWPVVAMGRCPGYLVYDGARRQWFACGDWRGGGYPDLATRPGERGAFQCDHLAGVFSRSSYESAVARAIDYIGAGDVFQINLTQRFTAEFNGTFPLAHRAAFARLATVSPAWYGAYLELPGDGVHRAVASTSPELFLEVNEKAEVVTRPIKGTRPAAVNADELRHSEKDKAELAMIVDLLRNDLGRVCDYGSIHVTEPRTIETHPTVHHGVATIVGRLHARRDVMDLLRASLPGGSITGAPKVRAMQIIEELEPVRRGPYCGCIGYLDRSGACLNIAIRTMLIESTEAGRGRVDFSVGGGVVADSRPTDEYQETLDKAAAMLRALGLTAPERGISGSPIHP